MCGIVGVVGPGAGRGLTGALDAIRHRGPDSEGVAEGPAWAMGIRRLAIIDVQGGNQPLTNEDESIWVVCNGEIYNHVALRERLRQQGHVFRTGSDVEVIVHLYEEYGEHFVEHLHGMFGIFLATPEGCFVARDRLGIKPLYQMQTSHGLAFASEIRALLALPGAVKAETDDERLADYFTFRYVPEPQTAFIGIERFPAGQITRIDGNGLRSRRYWELRRQPAFTGSFDDAVEECETRLSAAVKSHLMSERPTGVFLSGGLDSSVLAALAVRQSAHPMPMLTASFPGSDLDEADYARQVAEHLGAEHHIVSISSPGLAELQRAVDVAEDLVSDPALIPFVEVSRRARESLTVALVGEGSDETNVGYRSFLQLQALIRRRRLGKLVPFVGTNTRWAMRLGLPKLDESAFLARFTNLAFPIDEYPPLLPRLRTPVERTVDEINRLVHDEGQTTMGRTACSGWPGG